MSAFRHVERDRTIVFGPDALRGGLELLPVRFALVTTDRAAGSVPGLAARADAVVAVPPGPVDELAAGLRGRVAAGPIVALGGGRVIDVAKAIAAAEGIADVIAIPTSLSGAEMTRVHRHARGVDADVPRVRPSVVLNDPRLSASLPAAALAASSANALAHAVAAATDPDASPIAAAIGRDAIRRTAASWAGTDPDRSEVALAALLAGWSIDLSGLGAHHALAQTAVRGTGLPHADVNAALLPHTLRALRVRGGAGLAHIDRELEVPLEDVAAGLRARAGIVAQPELIADPERLDRLVATAAKRPEARRLSPPMDAAEIRALYEAAAG